MSFENFVRSIYTNESIGYLKMEIGARMKNGTDDINKIILLKFVMLNKTTTTVETSQDIQDSKSENVSSSFHEHPAEYNYVFAGSLTKGRGYTLSLNYSVTYK